MNNMGLRYTLLALCGVLTGACINIEGPENRSSPESELLKDITLASHSIIMSVGDSLKVSLQATTFDGTILQSNVLEMQWRSSSNENVQVDSLGVLRAIMAAKEPIVIIASAKYGPVTKADTMEVIVTNERLDISALRITLLDSSNVGYEFSDLPRIMVDAYDQDSLIETGLRMNLSVPRAPIGIELREVNALGQSIFSIRNDSSFIGEFYILLNANVYGRPLRDSARMLGLYPASYITLIAWDNDLLNPFFQFSSDTFFVQRCASLGFYNITPQVMDIIFDSAASMSGCESSDGDLNIYNLFPGGYEVRRVSTEGMLQWYGRSSITGERESRVFGSFLVLNPE